MCDRAAGGRLAEVGRRDVRGALTRLKEATAEQQEQAEAARHGGRPAEHKHTGQAVRVGRRSSGLRYLPACADACG